jgi:protoporphyrinogen oxidase
MKIKEKNYILGGGMTGLSAGLSSGLPVFEATTDPGGICSSYYVRPGETERLAQAPADEEAYRFEIGGGHWIFGGDPTILRFIKNLAPVKSYNRRSSVYFRELNTYVPYPLQNHLRFLGKDTAMQVLLELVRPSIGSYRTMKEWLEGSFGPTMGRLFFEPFHNLYTAGLHAQIAPQDAYKSPVDLSLVIRGAFDEAPSVGYNVTFIYPEEGLNTLSQRMASLCNVYYDKRAVKIDVKKKEVYFADGTVLPYETLISTLPLNIAMEMAGLEVEAEPDPYTAVLVLNIGAIRGEACPEDHWLYNPDAKSGFHRVGFYSNVDHSFLPRSARKDNKAVSIYVERAYVGGTGIRPSEAEMAQYAKDVVQELQNWGYIEKAEVVDPTWIEVAYTWSYPKSRWKQQALRKLEEYGIQQVGRYGRWIFQGIADSIKDGFFAGASLKNVELVPLHLEMRQNGRKATTSVTSQSTAQP